MQNHDIGAYVQRGRQAMVERRFDDAREIYQQILALEPTQPRAWLALSALAQRQGDFRESIRTARAAVPAWKSSGSQQFITELSMRLLVLGEYREARDIIASANWSDPVVLRYSMGLVQYLGLVEAHEQALQLADHALSRISSPPVELFYSRATALRYLGRMQEATEAYERCIALNPLYAEAHWALAHHESAHSPGARVQRLRKAIAHTSAESEDAIYLQYALFKELDDAGDVSEAWRALELGARKKRERIRYDASLDDAGFRALQETCSEGFFADAQSVEHGAGHTPIFIVGLPRSGTTLLERLLGNHPRVKSAGELNDFPSQISWEINRFLGECPDRDTLKACGQMDFAALGKAYLDRTTWRAEGADFLVDKLPNNVLHAGFIRKALPKARIVIMRRNGLDSCFSTFKHLFSGSAYPYSYHLQEMAAHYDRFERLVGHWERVLGDGVLTVDYETLVSQPALVVPQIAKFCGISYQDGMLDIRRNISPSATASASQIREGVHVRNVDSWKRYGWALGELSIARPG